jgi:3D (Asp-Asp-Asp) domain-containing protein
MTNSTSGSRKQKQSKYLIITLLITLVLNNPVAQAKEIGRGFYLSNQENNVLLAREDNESLLRNIINQDVYTVKSESMRGITAYNVGDIYQCDGNPCIAANGENICEALDRGYRRCAANFVPFGTILEIEGYGQCMVTDRMNSRYPNRVDIAFKYGYTAARDWGYKQLNVKILEKVVTNQADQEA